ncbi:MAG TPA: glycosyltransferase family 39 protein [Pyrinomonadaceae bacterium]|nr:glycosyltransferase family 39 protein [Pyrinomonadaceae bacterium]
MLKRSNRFLVLCGLLLLLAASHALNYPAGEPFFNNDETRHVMTGVYFRDLLHDLPIARPGDYTISYYLQYPALGLLVWPPCFYFVEGVFMSVFGTSFVAAKSLVAVYAAIACCYLFFLVCRTHDRRRASVAVLVFGLSPLVFQFSSYVMLEVPTLAAGLAATFYFLRYLDDERRRDIFLAALSAALAALTRFDAVYLLPFFLILLVARGRPGIIRRREVLLAGVVAALLVLPFYALTTAGIGWFHFKNVTEQVAPGQPDFFSLERIFFYPSSLPGQLGWLALLPAVVGCVGGLTTARRGQSLVYFAMIVACYVTFTPMAEIEPRHTIYWVPAFALFAAEGLALLVQALRAPKLYLPLAAAFLSGMAWQAVAAPQHSVRGYEEAARHVVAGTSSSPFCLFIGNLNGNFIYQVRRRDDARRLWVLRADKLLYSVLVNQEFGYKQFAASDEEILSKIYRYDPEFVVMQDAQTANTVPAENHVRAVINNHPERFRLEKIVPVETDDPAFRGMQLKVFRNILRNDNPERQLDIEVLMLRRSVQAVVP